MSSLKVAAPLVNPVKAALSLAYRHHTVVPMKQFHLDKNDPNAEPQELYLPMVLLLSYEEDQVEANAYADTKLLFKGAVPKKDEPSQWDRLLDAQRAYWTIYLSTRLPNDLEKKWFDSKDEVTKVYTWDSANVIMSHYLTIKMTQPCYQNIDFSSPTVFQDILDQIKKFGTEDKSDFFFNSLTTHAANRLIKFLVKERESYRKNGG